MQNNTSNAPPIAPNIPTPPQNKPSDTGAQDQQANTEQIKTKPNKHIDPNAHLTDKTYPEDLSKQWRRTKCINCGYLYEGSKPLTKCPKCGNTDPDKFVEAD